MKRNANAHWVGSGKEGHGTITTQSNVLNHTQYSFNTRFENGVGTNPEELVAAAHAGCFSMKLSFNLSGAGFIPTYIDANCNINFENGVISESHIHVEAVVPNIDEAKFLELVKDAELNCPISKLLNTKIIVEAILKK